MQRWAKLSGCLIEGLNYIQKLAFFSLSSAILFLKYKFIIVYLQCCAVSGYRKMIQLNIHYMHILFKVFFAIMVDPRILHVVLHAVQ